MFKNAGIIIKTLHIDTGKTYKGDEVRLSEVCFSPMFPDNTNCAIFSVGNYFQHNLQDVDKVHEGFEDADYASHINICAKYVFVGVEIVLLY